ARGDVGHVPVLANELLDVVEASGIELQGAVAVDCTFGDGGHARLLAERLGATGTLIAIDRDPLAERRFEAFARDAACSVRFIRAGYAEALELLAGEGLRAGLAYFDLGMSSMQLDTRERRFASPAGTPPSAPSRRCGSPSTTSWDSSTAPCRLRGRSSVSAASSPASPSTRWRTAVSSASWRSERAAACARPSSPCACADV